MYKIEASRGAAARGVTVKLQNSAESGERSVLTLDSLCLACCLRDTA